MSLPQGPEGITAEWLRETLGRRANVAGVEQIGIGVGILGRLFRVSLDDGSTVVVKLPSLDESARMNVVEPLRFYEKEVAFYTEAAAETPMGTPSVHHASFDPASGDFVIVMEDVNDRRMADQIAGCTIPDAKVAVDALVDLHAHWWASGRLDDLTWLQRFSDPPFPQVLSAMFKQSWPRAEEILGDHLSDTFRDFGDRFPDLVQWFADGLSRAPHTLVHGDYRLDNLFFATDEEHLPVTVLDWQICLRGRGGYDLGYFLSQSLSTADRRANESALIDRYHSGLAAKGVDYPRDELEEDYSRTVAWCFIYPVTAAGQIEFANERQRQLVEAMLRGAMTAIEDREALELLPA